MGRFKAGDKVIINHGIVATIQTWDESGNIVVYVQSVGGGTDTTTAPISHTLVEPLGQELTAAAPAGTVDEIEPSEDAGEVEGDGTDGADAGTIEAAPAVAAAA